MIALMFGCLKHLVGVGSLVLALSACASLPEERDRLAQCRSLIDRVDQRIVDKQAGDAEAARVSGFPYLRVNRFLASFRYEVEEPATFEEWVRRLRALDREARTVELQNLGAADIIPTLDECAELLLARGFKDADFKSRLLTAARPPHHYNEWVRAAGFYPLSHFGVALGFERWKDDNLPAFGEDPSTWSTSETRYTLAATSGLPASDVATFIDLSAQNTLNIPDLTGSVLMRLAEAHAPVFAVEEASAADRIGRPFWSETSTAPRTDPKDPVVYVRLAHTRMQGEVLPQLVYTVWFPERPKEGTFDILGGSLDGLVWRVTFNRQGRPLVYDSFHSCGCYHLFFPTSLVERVRVSEDDDLREEPLTPMPAPQLRRGERTVLHLASGSHYLRGLSATATWADAAILRVIDEHAAPEFGLRSLTTDAEKRRSLFMPDGIVAGTERVERFILWPMGISSPGAMRQWGTHATAFVGTRHADDPYLFDKAFKR